MLIVVNDLYNVQDAVQEHRNLVALNYPIPPDFAKANSLFNPTGPSPARGWFLLLRKDIDKLDKNGLHTIKMQDDSKRSKTFRNLMIAREPVCITPSKADDSDACFLVEFADKRHVYADPFIGVSINKQYNVRAPAYITATSPGCYYEDSLNSGSAWTWSTMTQNIWELMSGLGTFPSLPITPNGTPEGWIFPGVSAWDALTQVLYRVGCVVSCDLTASSNQYSIVQVGASDNETDRLITKTENANRKIFDREYISVVRGKVPEKVRVFFHRMEQHYGNEQTTPQSTSQWQTSSVYKVDITGPETSVESGTVHPIWDDLPAFYGTDGTLQNESDLNTRAQERSDDFYRMLRSNGGGRMQKIFTELADGLNSGKTIRGISWRQDLLGIGDGTRGGLVTEIVRHPYLMLRVNEYQAGPFDAWCECDSSAPMFAPDYRKTQPIYPHYLQIIEIANGTADGSNRFDATVEQFNPSALTWGDKEQCYAIEVNGLTKLTTGDKLLGRLSGYNNGRPIYQVNCCVDFGLRQTTETVTTNQNNYTLPSQSQWHKITTTTSVSITGFNRNSVTNRVVEITNAAASAGSITIPHQSGSSSSSNQVDTPYGQSVVIPPGETIKLKHDTSGTGRWKFAERPATLVESGSGTPSHTAPKGTLYFEDIVENIYINTDGSTTWRLVAGPSIKYDRLTSQVYSETSLTGNTTLTYASHGDAWNRCSGTGPYTITFFTPSAGYFIGIIAATSLTGTVTLSGSFDTADGQVSSLELKAGWSYEFMGLSSRWRLITSEKPGSSTGGMNPHVMAFAAAMG